MRKIEDILIIKVIILFTRKQYQNAVSDQFNVRHLVYYVINLLSLHKITNIIILYPFKQFF